MNYEFEDLKVFIADKLRGELNYNAEYKNVDVIDYVATRSSDKPNRIRVTLPSYSVDDRIHNYRVGNLYSPYGFLKDSKTSSSSVMFFMVDPIYDIGRNTNPLPNGLYILKVVSITGDTATVNRKLYKFALHTHQGLDEDYYFPDAEKPVLTSNVLVYSNNRYIDQDKYTVDPDKIVFDSSLHSLNSQVYIHYFYRESSQNFTVENYQSRRDILPFMYIKFGKLRIHDEIRFRVTETPSIAYEYFISWKTCSIELKLQCENEMARDKLATVLDRIIDTFKREFPDKYNIVVSDIQGNFSDGQVFGENVLPTNLGTFSFNLFLQSDSFVPLKTSSFNFTDVRVYNIEFDVVSDRSSSPTVWNDIISGVQNGYSLFGELGNVDVMPALYTEYFD